MILRDSVSILWIDAPLCCPIKFSLAENISYLYTQTTVILIGTRYKDYYEKNNIHPALWQPFIFLPKQSKKAPSDIDHRAAIDSTEADALAREVVDETLRSWQAYKKYAWGHDALAPLSKSHTDWYEEPLYISPIDAYSTLFLMGLKQQAQEIEQYVVDSLNFDKNIDAKIFEVNIRILGGLLSMYELSGNPKVLEKAVDFADRMLPAFDTQTGIPKYWVNLKTGVARGDTVNVAEAGTYTFEMGILSYYTKDPKYYQAGKKLPSPFLKDVPILV